MSKKQISEKKLQANRKNAKKSTGPKTPEGKAKSSRNALKHGLLAQQILINDDDPNEKTEDFEQLLNDLIDELKPQGSIENLLVERIAICYWRLRRVLRYEAQSIRDLRQDEYNPYATVIRQFSGKEADPHRHILPNETQTNLLVRYENMIDRQLNRSMRQLQQLQSTRQSNIPPSQGGSKGGNESNIRSSPITFSPAHLSTVPSSPAHLSTVSCSPPKAAPNAGAKRKSRLHVGEPIDTPRSESQTRLSRRSLGEAGNTKIHGTLPIGLPQTSRPQTPDFSQGGSTTNAPNAGAQRKSRACRGKPTNPRSMEET